MLNADERIVRSADPNELVEFDLNGSTISVLRFSMRKTIRKVTMVVPVLMTSCHVFGKLKNRSCNGPYDDHPGGDHECQSAARRLRRSVCDFAEQFTGTAARAGCAGGVPTLCAFRCRHSHPSSHLKECITAEQTSMELRIPVPEGWNAVGNCDERPGERADGLKRGSANQGQTPDG